MLEVVGSQITADPGVNLTLPLGGKLELALTKSSKYLVGYYTDPALVPFDAEQPVFCFRQLFE